MERKLTETEKNAARESAAHWERMIQYVKETGKYSVDDILEGLGETYSSTYCPLCRLVDSYCTSCPLAYVGNICSWKGSTLKDILCADNVDEWLLAANRLLITLQSLAYKTSIIIRKSDRRYLARPDRSNLRY